MATRIASWFWMMVVAIVWSLSLAGAAAYFVVAGMNGDNAMLYGIASLIVVVWYVGITVIAKGGR